MRDVIDRRSLFGMGGAALVAGGVAPGLLGAATPGDGDLVERLKAFCAAERRATRVPGLAVALVDAKGVRHSVTDGVADAATGRPVAPEHLFQIGSITKSMAALAVFRLAQQGRLDLDAPLGASLDGLPLPEGTPIRLAHVLNHSSGMPGAAPAFPRSEGRLWRGFEPGSRFAYSNGAYALLNMVIERASGLPFDQALRRLLFDPLGMRTATARIDSADRGRYAEGYAPMSPDRPYAQGAPLVVAPWVDFTGAAGSVAATAADMADYVAWIIRAAAGRPGPLLGAAMAKRFLAPTIAAPNHGAATHQANGFFVDRAGDRTVAIHHTGGMLGFSSALRVDPVAGVGAFAGANLAAGGYRPRRVADYAVALLAARARGEALPEPPAIPDPTAIPSARDYAGRFRAGGDAGELRLRADGARLYLAVEGREVSLQSAPGRDLFIVPHPRFADYPLGFVRDGDRIAYAYHGRTLYAPPGGALPRAKADWSALEGAYLCENPWRGTVRVVARGDGLFIDGHLPLIPIGDGLFREGAADWSPERVRFDAVVNGRCQRLSRSGTDYFRVPGHA